MVREQVRENKGWWMRVGNILSRRDGWRETERWGASSW